MADKLELFYPVKPFWINQKFGDSKSCTEDTPNIPVTQRKVVTALPSGICPAGYVPLYPLLNMKGHTGEDLMAKRGQILRSMTDGVVKEIQLEAARGLGVGIITEDRRDMGQYGVHYTKTRQWHLLKIFVTLGQKVKCGDPIGLADSTGLSSGDHDHVECKPVEYYDSGDHFNVFQDNGYFGAIDPGLFWNGIYAENYRQTMLTISEIWAQIARLKVAIASYKK